MKSAVTTRPAKIFRNGNSVAVRLPKGWAKPGAAAQMRVTGKRIILEKTNSRPKTLAEVLQRMRRYDLIDEPFVREQPPYPVRDFD
jgi:virulence-associated protein VagC